MKNLFIIIAFVFVLLVMWVARVYGFEYALIPVLFAVFAGVFSCMLKEGTAKLHKLVFLLLATIFTVATIYVGLKSTGVPTWAIVAMPATLAVVCILATCLHELNWDTVAVLSIPVFSAGGCIDPRIWWFLIPSMLFILRNITKENENLNQG